MKTTTKKVLCICVLMACTYLMFAQQTSRTKLPDRIPYRKGNKWGYSDRDKKIVIPVSFDDAGLFGVAPENMDVVLPDSLAWVKKGNKEYWINTWGKLTPVGSMEIAKNHPAEEQTMLMVEPPRFKDVFTDAKTGKKGIIDFKDDTLLPAYFEALDIIDPYDQNSYYVKAKKEGKWGVIMANTRKWLFAPGYDEIEHLVRIRKNGKDGAAYKVTSNGLVGVYINDKLVVPVRYKSIKEIERNDGTVFLVTHSAGSDLFDLDGKLLTNGSYEQITYNEALSASILPARKNGMWGLVGMSGKLVVNCKYESCDLFLDEWGLCRVKYKGKIGYVDSKGTEYFED